MITLGVGSVILLVAVGMLAGWVNTLAGGGSMLTVPALMWLGLPADVANGTSRIAILAQGATGVLGFRRAKQLDGSLFWAVALPSLIGAAMGAYAATLVPNSVFRPLLICTFVIMAGTLFISSDTLAPPPSATPVDPRTKPSAWLALMLAGFYGGFIQAGVGFVLLAVFGGLLRIDLVRGNGLKVAVIFLYSIVVVIIFAARARVDVATGVTLAVGNALGAELGVRFAVTRGQAAIKRVLFVAIVLSCIALFWK